MSMQPDPDPLDPTDIDRAYAEGWADGWDDSLKPRRFTIRHLVEVAVAVAMLAALLGYAIGVRAATRPETSEVVATPVTTGGGSPSASLVLGVPQAEPPDAGSRTPAAPEASAGIGEPLTGGRSPEPHFRVVPQPKAKPPAARPASNGIRGTASWLCHPPKWPRCTWGYPPSSLVAAAGPELRHGHWRGRFVTVWNGPRHVRVRLVDYCECPDKLIDLYWIAFSRLADPSVGLLRKVTVR